MLAAVILVRILEFVLIAFRINEHSAMQIAGRCEQRREVSSGSQW